MAKHAKLEFEGLFLGGVGLVVCIRVETGGVPRFENMVIKTTDMDLDTMEEIYRFMKTAEMRQADAPWADNPIPGIG